jgi:hypothetical protein
MQSQSYRTARGAGARVRACGQRRAPAFRHRPSLRAQGPCPASSTDATASSPDHAQAQPVTSRRGQLAAGAAAVAALLLPCRPASAKVSIAQALAGAEGERTIEVTARCGFPAHAAKGLAVQSPPPQLQLPRLLPTPPALRSGIRMSLVSSGRGEVPKTGGLVLVDVVGTLQDGRVFIDTKAEGQAPLAFELVRNMCIILVLGQGSGRYVGGWQAVPRRLRTCPGSERKLVPCCSAGHHQQVRDRGARAGASSWLIGREGRAASVSREWAGLQ